MAIGLIKKIASTLLMAMHHTNDIQAIGFERVDLIFRLTLAIPSWATRFAGVLAFADVPAGDGKHREMLA